jgi:hypothetical protein
MLHSNNNFARVRSQGNAHGLPNVWQDGSQPDWRRSLAWARSRTSSSKGAQIKALREQIKARNASKYDRMNQHGADPGMITSSIARANKKDRDAIKRLQAKISRFSD